MKPLSLLKGALWFWGALTFAALASIPFIALVRAATPLLNRPSWAAVFFGAAGLGLAGLWAVVVLGVALKGCFKIAAAIAEAVK